MIGNENACAGETAQAQELIVTTHNQFADAHCTTNVVDLSEIRYDNPTSSYNLFDTAIECAARGWKVLPLHGMIGKTCGCHDTNCGCPGKHPVTAEGFKSATTDPTQIEIWWQSNNTLNVGVATGAVSGIFVLDIDIKQDKRGDLSLAALEAKHGALPETVEAITGSGGRHLIFEYPGFTISNKQNSSALGDGIDVRGDGGYIVAPGSVHKSGGKYEWKAGHSPKDLPVANAPQWLLDLLTQKATPVSSQSPTTTVNRAATPSALPSREKIQLITTVRNYLAQCNPAVQGDGGDAHTFSVAGNVRKFVANDSTGTQLDVDEITDLMMEEWNTRCMPPWKRDELRKKVESGVKNGTPRPVKIIQPTASMTNGSGSPMLENSDTGNATRFVRDHGEDVRFCPGDGWLLWTGTRWKKDHLGKVMELAKRTARGIAKDAEKVTNTRDAQDLLRWAASSMNVNRLKALVELAKTDSAVAIMHDRLDSEAMLLNCLNGTIDLKTGQLQPHRREDLITKICPVNYDPSASCPEWMDFLDLITGGNTELQTYIQRAIGYSLTGDTSEQCLFFLYGSGKNGKTTFTETIGDVLGNEDGYSATGTSETFMTKKHQGIGNDIAMLDGSRFVVTGELEQDRRWEENTVKKLTGDGKVTARFLHKEFFTFRPGCKLWFCGNHKPNVTGTDTGFWRRMRLVPFTVEIPDARRKPTTVVNAMLKAEWPGILTWAVKGCLDWQKSGLGECEEIQKATEEYREENDYLAEFIAEKLLKVEDDNKRMPVSEVYKMFQEWADNSGIANTPTKQGFNKRLVDRGFKKKLSHGDTKWIGVMERSSRAAYSS